MTKHTPSLNKKFKTFERLNLVYIKGELRFVLRNKKGKIIYIAKAEGKT